MHYRTVFDLLASGYRTDPFVFIGLGFAAFGALLAWFPFDDRSKTRPRGLAIATFAALWSIAVIAGTYSVYWKLAAALREGRAHVTEGRVSRFQPKTSLERGSPDESFCVGSECFHYSGTHAGNAFKQTRADNGPIRDGLAVRVTSYEGKILRLEVADR